MLLRDLLENVDIVSADADPDTEITGVSRDSRTVRAGELFIAVRGYASDGHGFIAQALGKGAACTVCETAAGVDGPYVQVVNTRRALAVIAANWYRHPARRMKLIGVTGTNGKTTVTNLVKELLEKCGGKKVGLIGTNRNMIGDRELDALHTTPEALELHGLLRDMADGECEYAVMEVSSHALYLERVYGLEFDVGVFTNLTPDHLDFHETMEEYAEVKSRLFRQCKLGVVNADDAYADIVTSDAECPIYTFSVNSDTSDLAAKSVKLHPDKIDFCALTIGTLERAELRIPGMFSVYNALAAMAVMLLLGYSIEDVSAALGTCSGVKGRAEVVPTGRDFTVIIDYAHTPDALKNILTAVRGYTTGRLMTLFGCGGDRDRTKRPLMGDMAARLSDFVIVTSDNPRTEEPGAIIEEILTGMKGTKTPYKVIENRRLAIQWALDNVKPGDVLLLAGKGHETYQIFGKEKTHFDEREVIAECLGELR